MSPSRLKLVLLADAAHVNCQRWCKALIRAGAEVHVLSFSECEPNGMRMYRLPVAQLPGKLHYIAAVPYVRRLIDRIQPDVVVAYYVTGYGFLGALAARRPLVQVTSGSDILLAPAGAVMRQVVRYALGRADLVTAWAPHMSEAARELGVREGRILVLPRGIPFQELAGSRCARPEAGRAVKIISTRSLKADYNVDQLLRVSRILDERGVNFLLTIAGDGPQREELMAETRRLGLESRVRFAGFVTNDELPVLLAQQHLYISLVGSDGVSASLLESMAVGLLPIVPNHPANRFWITPGVNGVLLDDLSPFRVAEAICGSGSDLPLRERAWRENAEIVSTRADLYRNAELFVERFRQLTKDHPSH